MSSPTLYVFDREIARSARGPTSHCQIMREESRGRDLTFAFFVRRRFLLTKARLHYFMHLIFQVFFRDFDKSSYRCLKGPLRGVITRCLDNDGRVPYSPTSMRGVFSTPAFLLWFTRWEGEGRKMSFKRSHRRHKSLLTLQKSCQDPVTDRKTV